MLCIECRVAHGVLILVMLVAERNAPSIGRLQPGSTTGSLPHVGSLRLALAPSDRARQGSYPIEMGGVPAGVRLGHMLPDLGGINLPGQLLLRSANAAEAADVVKPSTACRAYPRRSTTHSQ